MKKAIELFDEVRLVPVVTVHDPQKAVELARVLLPVGVTTMEITLRTEMAVEAIQKVRQEVPDMLVGAGSIRRSDQVQLVSDAGAEFLVSPGYSDSVGTAATSLGIPLVPGAATATEFMLLAERGYELVKFFPAEINGGVAAIKALSAPLPEIRFFPTGGVSPDNVRSYLTQDAVQCVGGSWFIKESSLARGDFSEIEQLTTQALELIL